MRPSQRGAVTTVPALGIELAFDAIAAAIAGIERVDLDDLADVAMAFQLALQICEGRQDDIHPEGFELLGKEDLRHLFLVDTILLAWVPTVAFRVSR